MLHMTVDMLTRTTNHCISHSFPDTSRSITFKGKCSLTFCIFKRSEITDMSLTYFVHIFSRTLYTYFHVLCFFMIILPKSQICKKCEDSARSESHIILFYNIVSLVLIVRYRNLLLTIFM